MKSGRTFLVIVVILMSLSAITLAGCGTQPAGPGETGPDGSKPTQTPAPTGESTVISVPTEDLHPTVTVTVTLVTGEPPGQGAQTPISSHGGPVRDYVSLIDNLRAAGATVVPVGDISQPFFSVKGLAITVNGANVQVFEYPDEAAANADADKVSPDGSSVGTSMVTWVAPPHFYKTARVIVLYTGDDKAITGVLAKMLGPQFAGK